MTNNRSKDRLKLVEHLKEHGIRNEAVLNAMANIPREVFVTPAQQAYAYEDTPLPIDCEQTISQPFIVAQMTESIFRGENKPKKVLEIGTGSGYQAAILSQVVDEVYTVERIQTLLHQAESKFQQLNLTNIHTLHADGNFGWPEHAPYDAILVTAAAKFVPKPLTDQLADGGHLIIPVENKMLGQSLQLITRKGKDLNTIDLEAVIFVPLLSGKK